MLSASLIVLPILLINGLEFSHVSAQAWGCLIALGSLSTGIAYVFFYRLIEHTGATQAMMVTYLIPIFGMLFGKWFLDEALHLNMLFGGILILFGVMLTTGLIKPRLSDNQAANCPK
jgi:drug/metabolite transporter (DMT)-like permease